MPKLILIFKEKILGAYPLADGVRLTLGRRTENDIVIENLAVSGHHARIEHEGDRVVLTDTDSKNGTFCNGQPVTQVTLNNNDVVTIGKHVLQADWSDTITVEPSDDAYDTLPGPFDTASTMLMEHDQVAPAKEAILTPTPKEVRPENDFLAFLAGGEGSRPLSERQIDIGINDDADIVIGGLWSVVMGGPAAVITKQSGDYFLRYAGGWVKPKRNGSRVKGTVKLNHEDVVDVGPVKLLVQLSERMAA
jgi:pSer/pThr/pTyr-binding forkhead associated (FHA) protein